MTAAPLLLIALASYLRRFSFVFKFPSLRRFLQHGRPWRSLLCKAETCALHSSGSIAFHCDIRLLRRFSLHVILLSYFVFSRPDKAYWFVLTIGAIAQQYFLHMWLSHSRNAHLILNVKTVLFLSCSMLTTENKCFSDFWYCCYSNRMFSCPCGLYHIWIGLLNKGLESVMYKNKIMFIPRARLLCLSVSY